MQSSSSNLKIPTTATATVSNDEKLATCKQLAKGNPALH